MLIFIGGTSRRSSRFYFVFCVVFEIVLDIYHFQLTILIVCALHRHGSCVNPLGIARGQSHLNFMLFQLETLLIGLLISWGVKLFSSIKIHKIQHIHRVHVYCLITFNIKSSLNVPKISHISRKISQVSRFPAKSPDSRNKFVFLPNQPLLELSPPFLQTTGMMSKCKKCQVEQPAKSDLNENSLILFLWSVHSQIIVLDQFVPFRNKKGTELKCVLQ